MLRASTNTLLRHLTINGSKCGGTEWSLEFVRWRRKPRWLPVAKSKLFRVPERKQQNVEERVELMRLHNNYRMQMRSLRAYLREKLKRNEEISTVDHIVLTPEEEEAEFQSCLNENNIWNKQIAEEREARLITECETNAGYIRERLERVRTEKEERMVHIEAVVRHEKELAKTHITRDNLDTAIEYALANSVDYDFAIDLQGTIYKSHPNSTPNDSTDDQTAPKNSKLTSQKLSAYN